VINRGQLAHQKSLQIWVLTQYHLTTGSITGLENCKKCHRIVSNFQYTRLMSGSDSFPPVDGLHSKFALIPDRILFSHPEHWFTGVLEVPRFTSEYHSQIKAASLSFKLPSRKLKLLKFHHGRVEIKIWIGTWVHFAHDLRRAWTEFRIRLWVCD
jgi:hypothetical protein